MVYSLKPGHQPRKYRHNSGLQALTNRSHTVVMEAAIPVLKFLHQLLKVLILLPVLLRLSHNKVTHNQRQH
ncbi:hypothetical protein OIU85_010648 [Salix viminalis]|uniref:Uncharacterized protein n=1 Tax=Salix viminalis TaxID=40686 RepID=A0A6N2KT87_SALVM|nr:hypothetical protein OIU85_010648 [Salix viminalis]